ncbi:MAG: tetratricopeptide repeat protein [Candidatus Promineifilaceae bacterium]|nr:tetratricopeptide repeat protein [Candidatus Promineifilaceae bacterium]
MSEINLKEKKEARRNVRNQMSSSLLLPIALGLTILLAGVVLAMLAPWSFQNSISVFIVLILFAYLFWSTRGASWKLRLLALILAVPAITGIALSLVNGTLTAALIGVGVTAVLLIALRFFLTPISYRVAYNHFRKGRMQEALEIINKSILARPDFWESYQLRSLIYLSQMSLDHAQRDALEALELNPKAHPVYNTLGQVYLAQERFAEAEDAYNHALDLAPGYALYLYHLGLCEFRRQEFDESSQSFAAASRGTLPLIEYDLQNAYFLTRSLEELGDEPTAELARQQMLKFRDGLPLIKKQLANQPSYPHLDQMRADAADLERRLSELESRNPIREL